MAKSQYENFKEYSEKDSCYLLKVLKNGLHDTQSKIEFKDGSTYHVTKAGSRYWEKNGRMHREDGPACVWPDRINSRFYLFGAQFEEEDYKNAVDKLNIFRDITEDKFEDIMATITQNLSYSVADKFWQTTLMTEDPEEILGEILDFWDRYADLTSDMMEFMGMND